MSTISILFSVTKELREKPKHVLHTVEFSDGKQHTSAQSSSSYRVASHASKRRMGPQCAHNSRTKLRIE
jgi:hypothetical protein